MRSCALQLDTSAPSQHLQARCLTSCSHGIRKCETIVLSVLFSCTLYMHTDPAVLPLALVALIGFAAHKDYYALVANTESLDVVLHILHHYELPFKRLAGVCAV